MKWVLINLIKVYQYMLSPLLPNACRFTPTCSEYMVQAIQKYGILRGTWRGLKRLSRCHPWGGRGHDPLT
ncbi:MAG: membrane protein insertion efficiency factor YidD [Bacteroidia bacterium]|nr:membrane protein insertion efficiency factor YidD [Bacteroidia bacterium]MDW8346492.1 membrane protein insertion efficiency factor YidD [Bacteroidia bacterium]